MKEEDSGDDFTLPIHCFYSLPLSIYSEYHGSSVLNLAKILFFKRNQVYLMNILFFN